MQHIIYGPRRRRSGEPRGVTTDPPLVSGEPIREWAFSELRGDSLEEVEVDGDTQVGGLLHELHDFGPTSRDSDVFDPDGTSLPSDGIATGQIASTADGVTYWVGAEAPRGIASLPEDPIGGRSRLTQTRSFIKRELDASLSFTLTAAFIETTDGNAILNRSCPPQHADGLFCDLVKGELFLDVRAFTVPAAPDIIPFDTFFHVAGGATVSGFAENWDSDAWTTRYSQHPLWTVEMFEFVIDDLDGAPEGLVLMILRVPRVFPIDLSSVDVGQAFTLQSFAMATAYNRIAGPPSEFGSSATAFLRDPQGTSSTAVTFSGLEPTDVPGLDPPAETPVEPEPCPPGSPGNAGTLQFSAGGYSVGESNLTPVVRVTRTGGTTGPVTATVATSDGTAVAGTDYSPVHGSVRFADGDDTPRAVEVPPLTDQLGGEGDRTVIAHPDRPRRLRHAGVAGHGRADDPRRRPGAARCAAVRARRDVRHRRQGDDHGLWRGPLVDGAAGRRQGRGGRRNLHGVRARPVRPRRHPRRQLRPGRPRHDQHRRRVLPGGGARRRHPARRHDRRGRLQQPGRRHRRPLPSPTASSTTPSAPPASSPASPSASPTT